MTEAAEGFCPGGLRKEGKRVDTEKLLEISSLCVRYPGADTLTLRDVDLTLSAGQITCVIGESGCGKTTLFHSILQLPGRVEITEGSVHFRGEELKTMPKQRLRWRVLRCFGALPTEARARRMTDGDYLWCAVNLLLDEEEEAALLCP